MNLLKVSMLILGLMKISIKVKVIKAPQGYNPVGIGLRMAKAPQSGYVYFYKSKIRGWGEGGALMVKK